MTWSDKPTELQIGTIYSWFHWIMPQNEAHDAMEWLEDNATRRAVSAEMGRLRELKIRHLLDRGNCFKSPIWCGYKGAEVVNE